VTPYPHPIIAREGWLFLGAALVMSIVVHQRLGWWSIPFWLATLFILQFFRDPPRSVPAEADAVVSPADGRIAAVEKNEGPLSGSQCAEDQRVHERVQRSFESQSGGW